MTKFLFYYGRSWFSMFVLFAALACPSWTQAQSQIVSGIVTGEDQSPLPGTYVLLKGTSIGTATDANGKYAVNAPADGVLIFSFIGMTNQEVNINNQTTINVTLAADISLLSEVVVVGYGTQKKTDVTGSIASVSSKELKSTPITSLGQGLQGRAAGVQIMQTSNAPGGGISMRIRGGNSIQGGNEPLYVIDGFPLSNESSPTINPNDIESIDILKDASATAIYGSRGANGVVIITTKRGRSGKTSFQFESYYGVQKVRKKLDLLDATQLAQLLNDGIANTNADNVGKTGFPKAPAYTEAEIAALGKGTDWQDEIFQSAPQQNYQLTVSGGTDNSQFSISGNYFNQKGIVINSGYERGSLRMNLDKKVNEKLKLSNSLNVVHTGGNMVNTDGDGGAGAGVVYGAINFSPTVPVFAPDGSYTIDNRLGAIKISNPVALAKLSTNSTTQTRVLGNVSAEYDILDGLKLKVLLGANVMYSKNPSYIPSTVYAGVGSGGSAGLYEKQSTDWLNENTLTYQKTIGTKHKVTALLGYTLQKYHFTDMRISAQNFTSDVTEFNNVGSAQQTNPSASSDNAWQLRSYLARVNYDYDGRYLVTLSTRLDGSSRFGKGKKDAIFPSGSVAWRISQEQFMRDVAAVSDLKVRVSYGVTGNQDITPYSSLGALSVQNYNFGNALSIGYGPSRIANDQLGWESTQQTDLGLDLGLFTNRITLTADWYQKNTSALLYNIPLPTTSGFPSSLQNIGKIQNKGLELSISTVNVDKGFRWTTNFNISGNRAKIVSLPVSGDVPTGQASGHLQLANSGILRVGQPAGVFFGLVTDGIFQNQAEVDASAQKTAKPGDRRYLDITPDGKIDAADRVILGHALPDYIFGFTNNFSYKGFDLSIFFQGVHGNSIFNINRFEMESLTGVSNQSTAVLDRWTPTNASHAIPRATSTGTPYQVTSRQVEDGSYIRMKNIQLAYNFSAEWLGKIKLSNAKIYVSGQNLLTFTNYSGYDPEVSRFGQDNASFGSDYGSYPNTKMYLVGLNIGF